MRYALPLADALLNRQSDLQRLVARNSPDVARRRIHAYVTTGFAKALAKG